MFKPPLYKDTKADTVLATRTAGNCSYVQSEILCFIATNSAGTNPDFESSYLTLLPRSQLEKCPDIETKLVLRNVLTLSQRYLVCCHRYGFKKLQSRVKNIWFSCHKLCWKMSWLWVQTSGFVATKTAWNYSSNLFKYLVLLLQKQLESVAMSR